MAVRLRLMRMGKKKQPTYRVVAADKRKARNGRFIEIIGFYDPRSEPSVIQIENEKAVRWLSEGALPSDRVEKLLKISGAWDEFKGLPPGTSVTAPPAVKPKPPPTAEVEEPVVEDAVAEVEEPVVEDEADTAEVSADDEDEEAS
ncbi:MAG: 30S ribosomal protein S16 [Actinomycetota bacterium]|nr:30S ribosomal protein S16 [Actinomycetota bacterium]